MAPEQKLKKRKASVPADEVERVKKVKKLASEASAGKRKATDEPAVTAPKKLKAPKPNKTEASTLKASKGAASDQSSSKNDTEILSKKPKSSKDVIAAEKSIKAAKSAKEAQGTKLPKVKALELEEKITFDDNDDDSSLENASDNEEVDDQTEALLKGFESDDDDEEVGAEGGYKSGQPIPEINKKVKKRAKVAEESSTSEAPGVIYLGRIPHGFYEHEMRQYFGQFGDILRLRLSRNRKTGTSKHFAFIEFKSNEVAEIVVKTMDNYLLFGHILKCKLVQPEQVHANLWKGANKRFKKVPWNKIEGRKLQQGMTEQGWDNRVAKEEKRRVEKAQKLKELGYEFEGPKLKAAKDVPKKQQQALTAADVDEPKAIEASVDDEAVESALVLTDSGKSRKKKKAKKAASEENGEDTLAAAMVLDEQADLPVEDVAEEAGEKKKTKKRGRSKKLPSQENAEETLLAPVPVQGEQPGVNEDEMVAGNGEKKKSKKINKSKKPAEESVEAAAVLEVEQITLKEAEQKGDVEKPKKAKKAKKSKTAEA